MSINNDKEVGARIRHLRLGANLTQDALAELAGVKSNTVARLERGVHTASISTLQKLAKALKVKVSDILDD